MKDREYLWWLKGTARAVYILRNEGREAALCELDLRGREYMKTQFKKKYGEDMNFTITVSTGNQERPEKSVKLDMNTKLRKAKPEDIGRKLKRDPWLGQWMEQVEAWDKRLQKYEAGEKLDLAQIIHTLQKGG